MSITWRRFLLERSLSYAWRPTAPQLLRPEETAITTIPWGVGSGLDRVRRLAEDLPASDYLPHAHLGLAISRAEKGHVELRWAPGAAILNRAGLVHGGYIATALDEACGLAASSASEPATPFLTMSLNVDYVRPLLAGEVYAVTGTVLQTSRTRTLVRAAVTDAAGRLCCQASGALTPNRRLLAAADA
ncbi:PaaI family thioesterase [Kitasatospora phosalacinea]|uniref:PaaI family thioesterase n=1 Tax=Kitasatospora phosalacinea TaxID=2065 RepID=A0ABW6GRS8_9ACTN